jgi:hypothetical protein
VSRTPEERPDVRSFYVVSIADNQFDGRDLFQRRVLLHGTDRSSPVIEGSIMQVASFLTGLIFWMCIGTAVASFAFGTPWTGTVNGFLFAVLATFAWPWIMPKLIDDWMDDSYAPT